MKFCSLSKLLHRLAEYFCRHFFPGAIALAAAVSAIHSAHAQILDPFTGYTVPLTTTVVSENPPALRLDWNYTSNLAAERRIYRREKMDMANAVWQTSTPWGTPIAILTNAANTLSYTDTTLVPGKAYEYKMQAVVSDKTANESLGFVSGGINVPMPESRGKLLLLVDSSHASALAPELTQLEQDLAGDGWTVMRTDLARSVVDPATAYTPQIGAARLAEVTAVKNVIQTTYNADPDNVKAVYIVGHLAVPYVNTIPPDGHYNHDGAWPSDVYYAALKNNYSDTAPQTILYSSDPRSVNVPGDGKFEQAEGLGGSSNLFVQIGRVDFKDMTIFPTTGVTETELLRRYLRKAHDYRRKQGAYATIERRAIAMNWFAPSPGSESMTTSISATLGSDPALVDSPAGAYSPWFAWMEANPSKTYLIGSAQTTGGYTFNGAGSSSDFGLRPSRSVFNVLFGSWMGDWDNPNNFQRASLAGNASGDSLGLTCFWGGRPNLYMQSMALGETIGYAAWLSYNVDKLLFYPSTSRGSSITLMGDPALRLYSVQPPQNLQAASSDGSVTLSWSASTESNLLGYLVYRGTSPTGPFTKLTTLPISPTTYTDSTGTVGTAYTYLVKTIKKETTPAGTFQNPSAASFATITASSAVTSIPPAPTNLQVNAPNSTTINLTWTDNVSGETGYRVERRSTPAGSFSTLATLAANTTSYTDAGPLTAGATFYYRVVAVGSAGDSQPSNEVALSGYTGSIKFDQAAFHANLASGYADVAVRRFGGSTGTATVNYATESGATDSAQPGIDYTATSGTLTFGDGETLKTVRVTLLKSSPQPVQKFSIRLTNPTGGTQLTQSLATVLVEDPGAPVTAPWQSTVLGTNTLDQGAAGRVGNDLTSAFSGGLWNGGWSEDGRFTYQSVTGDTVMTMKINAPSVSAAALMVRSTVANNSSQMVAVNFSNASTAKAQFWARTSTSNRMVTPATAITIQVPYWARITRSGDYFTGEISSDGVTWTVLGSASVPGIPAAALYGFFHAQLSGLQRAELTQIGFTAVAAPTGPNTLAAARNVSGGVLTWVNTASNATGVRIERRLLPSGSFAEIASAQTPSTTYTDAGASPTQGYEYRVRAYNNTGSSAYSNTASLAALDPPSTPGSVTLTSSSNATVSLTWGNASSANQGYLIERRAEGEAQFTQIATTASLSYTDTTTAPDTGYQYRIRAYNQVLNSPYSFTVAGATVNRISANITTATGNGADAQISNGANADVNYRNATTLSLYSLFANGVLAKTDALLRFDISSLPTGPAWQVVAFSMAATYSANSTYSQSRCYAHLMGSATSSWSEDTITWNNRPYIPPDNPWFTAAGTLIAINSGYPIPAGYVMNLYQQAGLLLGDLTTRFVNGASHLDFYLNAANYNGTPEVFLATRENPSYAPPTLGLTLLSLAPTRATNLSGTVPSGGTVTLNWTDTSGNETGFRVEVSTNRGGSYSTVATLAANTTSLTTSAIPSLAGDHLYRVVAFNALGDATPSVPVTLAPNGPLIGISAWFDSYGLPTDGTGNGSPTAILAGDGIRNLMKYALGINPQASGYQGHLTTGTTTVGGSTYLNLTYARPEPAPTGVTYLPEACGDLTSWSGGGLVEMSSTVSNGVRTVTVRDGTAIGASQKRFLRMRVILTP